MAESFDDGKKQSLAIERRQTPEAPTGDRFLATDSLRRLIERAGRRRPDGMKRAVEAETGIAGGEFIGRRDDALERRRHVSVARFLASRQRPRVSTEVREERGDPLRQTLHVPASLVCWPGVDSTG